MKPCILCGKEHDRDAPHDFRGVDPILNGKINIQYQKTMLSKEPEVLGQDNHRKPGRPSKHGR